MSSYVLILFVHSTHFVICFDMASYILKRFLHSGVSFILSYVLILFLHFGVPFCVFIHTCTLGSHFLFSYIFIYLLIWFLHSGVQFCVVICFDMVLALWVPFVSSCVLIGFLHSGVPFYVLICFDTSLCFDLVLALWGPIMWRDMFWYGYCILGTHLVFLYVCYVSSTHFKLSYVFIHFLHSGVPFYVNICFYVTSYVLLCHIMICPYLIWFLHLRSHFVSSYILIWYLHS